MTSSKVTLGRFDLPGLTLPLNHETQSLFDTALAMGEDEQFPWPLVTLREITMLQLMNQITDKPEWEKKVFDDAISNRWKAEALATDNADVTQLMVDWVIDELRWKATQFKETGMVSVYNGDVVKSDGLVPDSLKQALKRAVQRLEDVPAAQKDWHPGSEEQVLDLVHPSLFPLVYGRSRIVSDQLIGIPDCLRTSGMGQLIPVPPNDQTGRTDDHETAAPYSQKFQWLPCEIELPAGSTDSKISSYINNLHPEKHAELYEILEQIIAKIIPQWNLTLEGLKDHNFTRDENLRIKYDGCEYTTDLDEIFEANAVGYESDEADWEERENMRSTLRSRVVLRPEPGRFSPPNPLAEDQRFDLRRDYGHRGLQVIIKLANIHLTPENPSYSGASWHVEGQMNEHICATAIYYYDSENITESRLCFRQPSNSDTIDIDYPQNEHEWLSVVYGCQNEESSMQEVGHIVCKENRVLTFPNTLQHQVQPFSLLDHTKPGHRKILALFLVDPNIRVISTANVPPQQREWWSEKVLAGTTLGSLANELADKIIDEVEYPYGLDEAKALRLELMQERGVFVKHQNVILHQQFSLCEH